MDEVLVNGIGRRLRRTGPSKGTKNPWMFFMGERYKLIRRQNPEARHAERMRMLKEEWNQLNQTEQDRYKNLAREHNARRWQATKTQL